MTNSIRILIIILSGVLFLESELIAREPKTVEEVIDLLIEQQTTLFPRFTCEYELSDSEINNGREILKHAPYANTIKIKAAKNKEEFVYRQIDASGRVDWFFPKNYAYSKKAAIRFNGSLGVVGAAFVSGYPGADKMIDSYPSPDNLFGSLTEKSHGIPRDYKKWLAEKKMVGWIEKVPLEWPNLPETIHLHLKTDFNLYDIYLDPNQGYLPVKLLKYYKTGFDKFGAFDPNNPTLGPVSVLLESKEVEKGKFFPMKVVNLWPKNRASDETKECGFYYYNITKLEYNKELTPEELSLPLPEDCIVGTDLGVEGPYITFRRNENVKPSDIPRIISMLQKQQESMEKRGERAIQDTALIDPPPSRGWSSYLWWAVGGLALLSLLLYLIRRFSRKSS